MAIRRRALALAYGAACHTVFAAGLLSMIGGMYFGMTLAQGRLPAPWAYAANALLLLQFPVVHSLLLTRGGQRALARLAPGGHGRTLATTTYAIVASLQLLALFVLWTPSGVVWWYAQGWTLLLITGLYGLSWLLLIKSIVDGGIQLQSGLLGWSALFRGVHPRFPDMPTHGLFRLVRQPIYVAFALTLWTVPVWTPDQLAVALGYTGYCVVAPRFKERRFERLFGERFAAYRARVPYWLPYPRPRRPKDA